MKKQFIRGLVFLGVILPAIFFLPACPQSNSPTAPPPSPTPTTTPYCTATPIGFSGSTNGIFAHGILITNQQNVPSSGYIIAINANFYVATPGVARVGFYSDVAGSPSALMAQSATVSVVAGVNRFNLGAIPVTAGNYWVASVTSDGVSINAAFPGSGNEKNKVLPAGPLPDPFGTVGGTGTVDLALSMEYCP